MHRSPTDAAEHRLGIRENWPQFSLLVLINACVGGMVGLERTVVPLVATQEFHLTSDTLIFSFIVAVGLVKALSNVASGMLADRFTRKAMLVSGWVIGLPVPFMRHRLSERCSASVRRGRRFSPSWWLPVLRKSSCACGCFAKA